MAGGRSRTLRGALAGGLAASVWAAQIPLDKRLFGCDFDDVELLGKAFTRGRAWPLVGWAVHIGNGAIFGALYANVATSLPLPSWARGPLAGGAEHLGTWPLTALLEQVHPAREELPAVFADPRAFGQSLWRHLLFGLLLGELERRLNVPDPLDDLPDYAQIISSNGHNGSHASSVPAA